MKFRHVTISVADLVESVRFYTEIVGLPVSRRFTSESGSEIVFLGEGETLVELVYNSQRKDMTVGRGISLGFEIKSLEATEEFLRNEGIDYDKTKIGPNREFLYVSDPDGVRIQFLASTTV